MATIASRVYTRAKRALAGLGFIVRTSQTSVLANDPSISSGAGAPTAAEPNGSSFLRTDGNPSWRKGGLWLNMIDLALQRYENGAMARSQLTAELADLANLRTQLTAAVADTVSLRTRLESMLLARDPLTALLADVQILRTQITNAISDNASDRLRYENGVAEFPGIADATQNGKFKILAPLANMRTAYRIHGAIYVKADTDNLWDLTGQASTDGTHYRAIWLYLDAGGTASIGAGTDQTSLGVAINNLPALDNTKSVIGCFIASPSCNFANALTAQGLVVNGWPSPVNPLATNPAGATALTTTNSNVCDATTNGKVKIRFDVEYMIAGKHYRKVATDNLWDLTGQASTDGTHYRAIWLYLDAGGGVDAAAGPDTVGSAAAAIAALPAPNVARSVIGIYVASPSCNFANALGAQGAYVDGWPSTLALTAAAPAAATATTTVGIGNGTTAGRLRTNADEDFRILGTLYRKAATDNLWDLHAETATDGTHYRAYWLYLDSSGTATFAAGTNALSAAAAIAALPAVTSTKAVMGVYVAGLSTNFASALAAQGTIYDGWPGTAY